MHENINRDFHYHSLAQDSGYDYQKVEIEFDSGTFQNVLASKNPEQRTSVFSFRSAFRYNSQLNIKEIKSVDEILLLFTADY